MDKFSPTLRAAMVEILEITKRYDIGAFVFLHVPEFSEYAYRVDPSYSCAEFTPDGGSVVVKGRLAHYGGNRDAQLEKLNNTANLFWHMQKVAAMTAGQIQKVLDQIEKDYGQIEITNTGEGNPFYQ